MQCFICVTYMIVACCSSGGARFLLRDVSLTLDALQSTDHDVAALHRDRDVTDIQSRDLQDELTIPTDAQYLPRLNHRLKASRYHHRSPKDLAEVKLEYPIIDETPKVKTILNEFKAVDENEATNEETEHLKASFKRKETRPKINNIKLEDLAKRIFSEDLKANTMAGASHIGNAKSQTVIKPTIIVNVRGSESSVDARFGNKKYEKEYDKNTVDNRNNEFNINQRISFDSLFDKNDQMKNPLKQTVIYDFRNSD